MFAHLSCCVLLVTANVYDSNYTVFLEKGNDVLTKRNPEFGGFSACFAVMGQRLTRKESHSHERTETVCERPGMIRPLNFEPTPAHEDGDSPGPWIGNDSNTSTHRPQGRETAIHY